MKWKKSGFEEFRKGTFGNGGQNLYVSAKGTLQRIFNFDVNSDGYFDIPIANSHSMWEKPPIYIFDKLGQEKPLELPSNGSFDAIFADLNGNGVDDLVVSCQHDGVHTDVSAIIYYGSEIGLSEKYRQELRVPNSLGVVIGDFDGDGKKTLAFLSYNKVRLFDVGEYGVESNIYTEIDIEGVSMAAGDIDGDGCDDLYVLHPDEGWLDIYWGGPEGLNPENKTRVARGFVLEDFRATSTTAGRKLARWQPWSCSILNIKGKTMTFRANGEYAVFESYGKDRKPVEEMRIKVYDPEKITHEINPYRYAGVMHATCGDLRGDGSNDLVIAYSTHCDAVEDLTILWEKDGYDMEKATRIPIRAARNLFIGKTEEGGKNYLFVAPSSMTDALSVKSSVFSFDKDGTPTLECELPGHEATRIISGRTYTDGRYQIAAINHEGEGKMGLEDISIFLGGEDGYKAEHRIDLPGCAAVDCVPVDFNDDGLPDMLVVNCAENGPHLDPGATIFWNGIEGFSPENRLELDTLLAHGCALGDFRHSGYIDMVFSGIRNPQLLWFKGGPDGYTEPPTVLTMGPMPDFSPFLWEGEDNDPDYTDEENAVINEFGGPRWLFAADFNGDGWLDLFVPQISGNKSFIFWGGPEGFSVDNTQALAVDGVVTGNAADLDGDGYLDLICSGFNSAGKENVKETYLTIYWGSKDGYTENRKSQIPVLCSNDLTINDFNGDGKLDIFSAAYHGGRFRDVDSTLYFGNDNGYFNIGNVQYFRTHSATGCLSGDFNGDGYIDLIVASHKTQGNHVNDSVIYWGGPDGLKEDRFTLLPSRGPHGVCTMDAGNIMDRSHSEYYISEAFDSKGAKAVKAGWSATNGVKTWVKIQLRCADTPEALETAEWSESFDNNADISALNLCGYVQYKLELGANTGCGTPRVTEVTVDFE